MTLLDDAIAAAASATVPHTPDPAQRVPFGSVSFVKQDWRSFLETRPAAKLVRGVGTNNAYNASFAGGGQFLQVQGLVTEALGRHGWAALRTEDGWNNFDWAEERFRDGGDYQRSFARQCRAAGLRPLILANSNDGAPCPSQQGPQTTVTADAAAGSNKITVDHPEYFAVNYSGLDGIATGKMADALVLEIQGHTLTLSRALRSPVAAGTVYNAPGAPTWHTLKYRPFCLDPIDNPLFEATAAGWVKYVAALCAAWSAALGTTGTADLGFDLDIWNEVTFGSGFLVANSYYDSGLTYQDGSAIAVPLPGFNDRNGVVRDLCNKVCAYAAAHPAEFAGVRINDGGANQTPFESVTVMSDRLDSLGKHPYPSTGHNAAGSTTAVIVNGDGSQTPAGDPTPGYYYDFDYYFPEFAASGIRTEAVTRDSGPDDDLTILGSGKHGRFARGAGGAECPVWITETGLGPSDLGITDTAAGNARKAAAYLRSLCLFVNKGCDLHCWFGAAVGDNYLGLVSDAFVSYALGNPSYPADDTALTSPALVANKRLTDAFKAGIDGSLTANGPAQSVLAVKGGGVQFAGDGTAAHPDLLDSDVFAWLPFRVNAARFAVPYYVMTRDMRTAYSEQTFAVVVTGLPQASVFSATDPMTGAAVSVSSQWVSGLSAHALLLPATDYPRVLIADSSGVAPAGALYLNKSPGGRLLLGKTA